MEIEIRDYHQQNYVCTLKRAGDEYVLTDNAGIRVGFCKSMPSGTGSRQYLQLFWNDGTQLGTVKRKLGLSSDDSVDSIRISGSVDRAHGGDALGARISDEIPVSEVDDEDLIKLLFGYVPSTESNQKADLHGIGSGGSGTKDEGNGDKAGQKKGLTKASLPIIIIAALGLMGIVGLILWLTGRSRSNEGPTSEAQPTAAPSFTAQPSVTDTPAAHDVVVDGVFFIKSAADGKYISGFGDKNNGYGIFGHYINMVSDKSDAFRFTPVSVEGSACRLATYDFAEGGSFCLNASYPGGENCGVDLWGYGTESFQKWIIEEQEDDVFCIYLDSDKSLCLTNLTADDSSPDDPLSVMRKSADISVYQEWYIIPADAAGFEPRPEVTPDPSTLPPDESDKYASDDFVVDGVFYIQDAATRAYIGVGGEKKNSSGVIGRYIDFVNDKSEAVRFTPVSVEGSSCRLATYDIGDEPFYLDAYNSREKNYGADLWGRGTDRDQRWILEKQGDGLYCIYLESNTSLCLTSRPSVQSDLVSVADRDPALSDFQQWFLVLAD